MSFLLKLSLSKAQSTVLRVHEKRGKDQLKQPSIDQCPRVWGRESSAKDVELLTTTAKEVIE